MTSTPSTVHPVAFRAVLTAALLTLAGCGSRASVPSPFEDGGTTRGSSTDVLIRVDVQNLNFNDITVWSVRQGQRIRLGYVTGKTDETFQISWNPAFPISFVIDVTGGRSCRTSQVGVERNARVWVSVPASVGAQPCRAGRS